MINPHFSQHASLSTAMCLAVMFLLLSDSLPALAQVIDSEEWLARDPRLKKNVTVARYRVRVGELLEEASRQTGVAITANPRDGADSEVITVYAREMAAADLLANVWSLLSYRQAAWKWEVEGDGKKIPYSYRLTYPKNARDFPLTVKDEARMFVAESLEASVTALDAAPDEKARLGAKFPDVNLIGDPLQSKKMTAFRSLTTREERAKLARGEMEKTVPRGAWTKETQQYVDDAVAFLKRKSAEVGGTYDSPYPDSIRYVYTDNPSSLLPEVTMFIGDIVGWPVGGSIFSDEHWRAMLEARWLMEGDSPSDAAAEAAVVPPAPAAPVRAYRSGYDNPAQDLLESFHRLTGIAVFGRTPGDFTLTPFYGKSVAEFVKALRRTEQTVKWRRGSLFIARTSWARAAVDNAQKQVPWAVMSAFRRAVAGRPDYNCTPEDIAVLVHDLTPEQLEALKESDDLFPPNMFIPTWQFLFQVKDARPLFAPLGRNKELLAAAQTQKGVRVRELPQEMRDHLAKRLPDRKVPSDMYFRIRTYDVPADEWAVIVKKEKREGEAVPRAFFLEMGGSSSGDKYRSVGSAWWAFRRVSELNAGRIQADLDMRAPFLKIVGEPSRK